MRDMQKGYTLIEMVIVVALASILSFLAYSSYNQSVLKTRRAEGLHALNAIQLAQQNYRMAQASYGSLAQVWNGSATTANGYYMLKITQYDQTSFTATATALGTQSSDKAAQTSCTVLTLTVNGDTVTQTPTACWTL